MNFHSILFDRAESRAEMETPNAPAFFNDLNLNQVVNAITARKQEYNLKPFFHTPLHDAESVRYRQEVMRDMENEALMAAVNTFAEQMTVARRYLALTKRLEFHYHQAGWFLEAVLAYCEAVEGLARDLDRADLKSHGLLMFRQYLRTYIHTPSFQALRAEAHRVKQGLAGVRYCVHIRDNRIRVQRYEEEADFSAEVERVFERFKQGEARDYRLELYKAAGMNHVEAQILDFVARLYPAEFAALDAFCARYPEFMDATICVFDREIQFYVAYLEFIAGIRAKGLPFCYPLVPATSREVYCRNGFDLALATAMLHSTEPVICNDFFLTGPERVIVVSGPNQGGKTTFARMFGQVHYLASLGCPVPGEEARLPLFDQIFTHFERQEAVSDLRGKLQDDLIRIHTILEHATSHSILILNEILSSAALQDAEFLSKEIMAKITDMDVLCVWVTFIDELAAFSEKTVSMVSTVDPENPVVRTYKIVRRPADGLAYALSIAAKHRLTYTDIMERIKL